MGRAPQYLAHVLIKFIACGSEKYNADDDGFDGFGVDAEIIKSRTNQAGQKVNLVYDKVRGFDTIRTSFNYAKSLGIVGGNRNGYYLGDNKDLKFTLKNMTMEFRENPELIKNLYSHIIPPLEKRLSTIRPEEMEVVDEVMDY